MSFKLPYLSVNEISFQNYDITGNLFCYIKYIKYILLMWKDSQMPKMIFTVPFNIFCNEIYDKSLKIY